MHAPTPRSTPPPRAILEIGSALGLTAAAALACSLPAALRVSASLEAAASAMATWRTWVALASAAREGLRAFGGPGARIRALGVGVALSWALVAMALFGSILRAVTHNRALAGVTYAFGALLLVVAVAIATRRVVTRLEGASSAAQIGCGGAAALASLAAVGWAGLRLAEAASSDSSSGAAAALVVDVLAFALAALFAARPSFVRRRALAIAGPPVLLVVAASGFFLLRDAPLREAIEQRAPMFAPLACLVPRS
jgi:hypothetical protein